MALVGLVAATMWMLQKVREHQGRRPPKQQHVVETPGPPELKSWPPLKEGKQLGRFNLVSRAAMGDWNGDGLTDLAVANESLKPRAFLQQKDGKWLPKDLNPSATLLAADFDGDGKRKLLMMADNSLELQFYPGPRPQAEGSGDLKLRPLAGAVGKLDQDAFADLALPSREGCVLLLRHAGGKTEQKVLKCPNVTSAKIVEGRVVLRADDELRVYSAPWTGEPVILDLGTEVKSAAFGDLDDDGHQDVVFVDPSYHLFVGYGSESGRFESVRLDGSRGFPLLVDLDDDGDLDIVNCDANWIQCLRNEGERAFVKSITRQIKGSHVLLVQDFNGDDRPDFVTATTAKEGPVMLYLQK